VKCTHCGADMQLRQEHCHACGKRVVVDFDVLAESVQEDAASRRGDTIGQYMKWVIMALLTAAAVIYAINDLYDKPLVYDSSSLPALPAAGNVALQVPNLDKPYVDPHATVALPEPKRFAYGYRSSPVKERLRALGGGDQAPEKLKSVNTAITDGLKFLEKNQFSDGSWPAAVMPRDWQQMNTKEFQWGNVGITSLSLLAFFGEGIKWSEDPKNKDPLSEKLKKALRYLIKSQDAETGRFGPADADAVHSMYNHGMATLALCEAVGLSSDEQLRVIAQKGIDYIVKAQTSKGGWNYHGSPAAGDDTSLSGWQIQALYAGKEVGLNVPDETLRKALELYRQATAPGGFVRYNPAAPEKEDENRTSLCGVALMTRLLLGEDPKTPILRSVAGRIMDSLPMSKVEWGKDWKPAANNNDDGARSGYDPYRVYYTTYGMYFMGGKDWDTFNDAMKAAVIRMQSTDGSWKCNDPHSTNAGTFYSTALSILTLQVYYRLQ
jgi:hypothetical protein